MIANLRVCCHCGRTTNDVAFYRRMKKRKCGTFLQTQNICIDCQRDYNRYTCQRWFENNAERKREINNRWKKNNRDKVNEIERRLYWKKRNRYATEGI